MQGCENEWYQICKTLAQCGPGPMHEEVKVNFDSESYRERFNETINYRP